MNYFKIIAEGHHPDWGGAPTYWFEIGVDGDAVRELECYPNGNILRYDYQHPHDCQGGLQEMVVDGDDAWWGQFAISADAFEHLWSTATAINLHEVVPASSEATDTSIEHTDILF